MLRFSGLFSTESAGGTGRRIVSAPATPFRAGARPQEEHDVTPSDCGEDSRNVSFSTAPGLATSPCGGPRRGPFNSAAVVMPCRPVILNTGIYISLYVGH